MGDTTAILNEAYQLIEAEDLAAARELIEPLLAREPNNPDVWWIYTHAVEDEAEGNRALDKVLELAPDYPGAAELRGAPAAKPTGVRPLQKLTRPTAVPTPTDDFGDFETAGAGGAEPRRRPSLGVLALIAVIILAIVGLLAILASQDWSQPTTTTPTAIAQATDEATPTVESIVPLMTSESMATAETVPTKEITATAEAQATAEVILPTEEPQTTQAEEPTDTSPAITAEATAVTALITEEATAVAPTNAPATATTRPTTAAPTATTIPALSTVTPTATIMLPSPTPVVTLVPPTVDANAVLAQALTEFAVTPDQIATRATRLGKTLVVNACATPGPEAGRVLAEVMNILTQQINDVPSDIQALAVNITDCTPNAPARIVAVPIGAAGAYARNEIDVRLFQSLWQPIE